MYRCIALFTALVTLSTSLAWAQGRPMRQFPKEALRGEIHFISPPQVELNGTPMRLTPGARLRGEDNMFVLTGALTGQRLTVHYTLEDTSGGIKDVWVLREEERAKTPWPTTPEQTRSWRFSPGSQTWTRP